MQCHLSVKSTLLATVSHSVRKDICTNLLLIRPCMREYYDNIASLPVHIQQSSVVPQSDLTGAFTSIKGESGLTSLPRDFQCDIFLPAYYRLLEANKQDLLRIYPVLIRMVRSEEKTTRSLV